MGDIGARTDNAHHTVQQYGRECDRGRMCCKVLGVFLLFVVVAVVVAIFVVGVNFPGTSGE